LRETLLDYLANRGHHVTAVGAVDDAIALIGSETSFDLYLTDVQTPGRVDGIQLAVQIVQQFPRANVIVMSGFAGYLDLTKALPARVVFLPKPFRPSELQDAIERLVKGPA
jgi:CheY-like chemotaxis protein